MSTAHLVAKKLRVGEGPQVWNELEHRLAQGVLTTEHVDAIFESLAEQLAKQRKTQSALHLPWGRGFVSDPRVQELASDEALAALATAAFQPTVTVEPSVIDAEGQAVEVVVKSPGTGPFLEPPVQACWELVNVTADGVPVQYTEGSQPWVTNPGGQTLDLALPDGAKKIRIEVEVACFRGAQKLDGFDSLPRSPRATSEGALKRWKLSAETEIE